MICVDKHYVADVVINYGLTDESLFDVELLYQTLFGV